VILILSGLLSGCSFNFPDFAATSTSTPDFDSTVTAAILTAFAKVTETARIAALSATATATATHTQTLTSTATTTHTQTLTSTATTTLTPTQTETLTPSTAPTDTPTVTSTSAPSGGISKDAIVAFFVIKGSGGPVACGDSLIPVYTGHYKSGNIGNDLKIALDFLFSAGQNILGLHNATYPSRFSAGTVEYNAGQATVYLSGNYVPPVTKCDAYRYEAQVNTTAFQFNEIKQFSPFIAGGGSLGDRLYSVMLSGEDE